MNESYINSKYNFSISGVNFCVEIDESVSAVYRDKHYPKPQIKPLHSHPLHELFFVFDEGISVTFENETVDYKSCILSIPPNTKHFTQRSTDYRILFSCSMKGKAKNRFSQFFLNEITSEGVWCHHQIKSEMRVYLEELLYLFINQKNELSNEIVISVLKLIIFHIYIYGNSLELNGGFNEESRYITISRMIYESTLQGVDVSLSTIARALHLGEKQTSKIIYKYYGKFLSEVVAEEKLEYALYLLTTTNIPVSEIAYKCNFHSENYFYHCFKKKFGTTPLKYRKQHTSG